MHGRPRAWLVEIIRFGRDFGAGPAIEEFRGAGGQVHASVTARLAKVIVPIRAVECNACAGEETTPRHARQVIDTHLRVAFVGHVDGRAFVIGGVFPLGRFRATRTAGATRPHDEAFILEGHDVLRLKIHVDGFQGVGNVARKRSQLLVGNEADVAPVEVEILMQVVVVDLIPDAPVRFVDVDRGHPMGGAVKNAVGVIGVEAVSAARVRIRDGDLAERLLAFEFGDGRLELSMDGLDIG